MRGVLLALWVGVFALGAAAEDASSDEPAHTAAPVHTDHETEDTAQNGAPDALEHVATIYGRASFYGKYFHGRRTASGEPHDAHALTAAHRSLPFGTWVRVQSLDSGFEVHVRINDRGPFVRGRVIDLSRAAAQALSMVQAGTHAVRLDVLGLPER